MGINAGIKVMRRITDEKRWQVFLRAVVERFKDDPRVCMELYMNFDADTGKVAESASLSLGQSKEGIQLLHLTEAFNFVPGDRSLLEYWNTGYRTRERQQYGRRNDKQESELRDSTIAKLQNEVIRLNYTGVDIEKLISDPFLNAECAIMFQVGESPSLPVYAHHFKAMYAKVSCGDGMADVALMGVKILLDQFFPGHTQYWTEFDEDKPLPMNDRISRESRDETDQFYHTLIGVAREASN